jgi:Ca2+-binding EF-hand superfamily protein
VIDVKRYGYLDFDNLKCFMKKFKKDISKPEIMSIIRRQSVDGDDKITFREFAEAITPIYPRLAGEQIEFNLEEKAQIVEDHNLNQKI